LVTIDVHNRDVVVGLEVEIQHIFVTWFNKCFFISSLEGLSCPSAIAQVHSLKDAKISSSKVESWVGCQSSVTADIF
jgi:hypothetical protein